MSFDMSWFKRESGDLTGPGGDGENGVDGNRTVRTEGLWIKCVGCRATVWKADLEKNLNVCPRCQHHFKLGARERIEMLLDPGYELVIPGCAPPIRSTSAT
jgi:acetyl-CoA carboxylase carboxyl transferase subunit beta